MFHHFLLFLFLLFPHSTLSSDPTIAFHISVTPSTLPLLSRFFTRIHHASNLYLITLPPSLSISRYSRKFSHRNVHISQTEPFIPDGISHTLHILDAMAFFLDQEQVLGKPHSFDYFIHCTPADYPTVTPDNMRKILSEIPPPGVNFFRFASASQLPSFRSEIDFVYYDYSLTFNRSLSLSKTLGSAKYYHPDAAKRTYNYDRGDKQFIVTHAYVKFASDSMQAKRLLLSLGDSSHVSQRFFATLAGMEGEKLGKLVRSTSLRCVNRKTGNGIVGRLFGDEEGKVPNMEFFRLAKEPCLFAGGFEVGDAEGLAIRDQIDRELLIEPGTQGKPKGVGYVQVVIANMKKVLA